MQALPFLHAFVQLKRLTRGEENIPQTIWIKQSACQLPSGRWAAESSKWEAGWSRPIPAWGTCTDFASNRCTQRDQLIRTLNWMVKVGLPAPAAFMVPPGWMRMARTNGSKPLASGAGGYPHGPLGPVEEYCTFVA